MHAVAEAVKSYRDAAAAYAAVLPGRAHSWVRELRAHALAHFETLGFPTTRHEDWKYTNVSAIERHPFRPAPRGPAGVTVERLAPRLFGELAAHRLVFVNGYYVPGLSASAGLPAGVTLGSLAQALEASAGALEPYLGRLAPVDTHSFAALNTAYLADGAYVHVARGAAVEKPIHLVFVTTEAAESLLTSPRSLIVLEDGAAATLVEQYVALADTSCFTNAVTEIALARGARLEHYRLQQESAKAYHVGGVHLRQERDSRYVSHAVDLGGLLVRNDLRSLLDAEGAECELNGLYVVDGHGHVDNHTCVDHAKPRGTSREFYKGVLAGRARAVFNGRVVVHPDAQHSDAQQTNHNLLLSRDAEVDTKPQLEIHADDVKCSHGATVGSLDEDALFYLRTRALDAGAARDLLTYAFADDVLARMRLAAIRRPLERELTARLLHGRRIEELV